MVKKLYYRNDSSCKSSFKEPLKPSEAKKQIVQFCNGKLDRYKIPAKVILMTESEYSERFKKKRL